MKYKVDYWALGKLNDLIEKYNRKSAKLNQPPLKFDVEVKSVETKDGENRWLEVSFEGDPAKINGWEFIGTIQHLDGQNILRSIPGRPEIPEYFREIKPHCEHCSKRRSRKDSYVLRKEVDCVVVLGDEEMSSSQAECKQVGRNCLRDFFGHDPSVSLALLDMIRKTSEVGGGGKAMMETLEYLTWVSAVANELGWNKDVPHVAWSYIFPSKELKKKIALGEEPDIFPVKADRDMAKEAVSFISEKESLGGFIANVKAAASLKYLTYKEKTLAGWVVGLYLKEVQDIESTPTEAQKRREKMLKDKEILEKSEFFGVVGERTEATVELSFSKKMGSGPFGDGYLYKFITDGGNVLTWFTSTKLRLLIGEKKKIALTVAGHVFYNGNRETKIKRMVVKDV